MKTCFVIKRAGYFISLAQRKDGDAFTVRYGKQVTKNLDYDAAARELGRSIMHALACEGTLDNGEIV